MDYIKDHSKTDVSNDINNKKDLENNNYNNTNNELKHSKNKEKIKTNNILYLGNLPTSIDNFEVYHLISEKGNFSVESMNIKRKINASYALVKLGSKREVEEAKKKLNLFSYKNRILKADSFQKEEKRSLMKNTSNNNTYLFFKDFRPKMKVEKVLSIFSQYGEITEFKPRLDNNDEFIGNGSVGYKDEQSCNNAITDLNNKILLEDDKIKSHDEFNSLKDKNIKHKKIEVMKFTSFNKKESDNSFPVILIKNIPKNIITNDNEFKKYMSNLCDVTLSSLIRSSIFGLEHNILTRENSPDVFTGIALLNNNEEIEKCLARSKDKQLNHLNLIIFKAYPSKEVSEQLVLAKKNSLKEKYQGNNIIVKNLPKEITEKDLQNIFYPFGKVKSIVIVKNSVLKEIKDKNGNVIDKQFIEESKGFGYILYLNSKDAETAIDELNNKPFVYNNKSLQFKIEYFNYNREDKSKNHYVQSRGGYKGKRGRVATNMVNNNQRSNMVDNFHGLYNQISDLNLNSNFNNNISNNYNISNNMIPHMTNELKSIESYVKTISINDPDRYDKIGEVLYNYILRLVDLLKLNNVNNSEVDDMTITSKLTGILLQSNNSLIELISDFPTLVNTLKDLINKIYIQ